MEKSTPRIFTRNFALLFAVNLLVIITYVMLFSTMAYYAVISFATSDALAGLTSSAFLIASMLARVLCGRFGESFGLKRTTVAFCILLFASCGMYLLNSSSFAFLLVTRVIHGLAFGVVATSVPALVAKSLAPEVAGVGTGYFMLSNTLGTAIGPWLGLILANGMHYTAMFIVSVVCAGVSLVFSLLIAEDGASLPSREHVVEGTSKPVSTHAAEDALTSSYERADEGAETPARTSRQRGGISSYIDFATVRFGLFVFISGFAYSSVSAFINGYSVEVGLEDFAPYVFLLYAITLMFSRPFAGKLMDTRGENSVIIPSFLLMALGFASLVFVKNAVGMLLVGPLMAFGFGSTLSTGAGILARDSRDDRTTLRMSTFYLLVDGGIGIGPFFLGMLIDFFGFESMYTACIVITLVGLVVYFLGHGKKPREASTF